jgi:hypothetical protein
MVENTRHNKDKLKTLFSTCIGGDPSRLLFQTAYGRTAGRTNLCRGLKIGFG